MNSIRAIAANSNQIESAFQFEDIPLPIAGNNELLIKVEAVSVNPVDTKIRRSLPPETSRILGWDATGIVVDKGNDVNGFNKGDRVYYAGSLNSSGSNAEYQTVDARLASHMPKCLNPAEAAAMPLTSITAWEALFDRLNIDPEEKGNLLIIGGAGGVGSIATQIAKQFTQLTVITTASRHESIQYSYELGADFVINWQSLTADIKQLQMESKLADVDYILNCNDIDQHWANITEIIKPQGHICSIVENAAPLDMGELKRKSATLSWEFMFTRSMYKTPDMQKQGETLSAIAKAIDKGLIKSTATQILNGFTPENFVQAHRLLESGRALGKCVIEFTNTNS